MARTDKNGTSEREHLEQVARQTGTTPAALIGPPLPDLARHLWDTFLELHRGRTYGMSGANPLTHMDIFGWCNLTGVRLSLWELEIVHDLDALWIRITNEGKG